jgi:hypothetical protein
MRTQSATLGYQRIFGQNYLGYGSRPFLPFTRAGLKDRAVKILSYILVFYFALAIVNFFNEMHLQHYFLFFGVTTSFSQRVFDGWTFNGVGCIGRK